MKHATPPSALMLEFSEYLATALKRKLPDDVMERAKIHLVDSIAAILSGSRLLPGKRALRYVRTLGSRAEAGVLGSDTVTSVMYAALANGISNVRFETANLAGPEAAAQCLSLSGKPGSFSHVLLDPPRTGARDILPAVAQLAPRRVVYVSCHPGSLARDVGILVRDHGFTLRAAGIVDMFAQTTHLESIVVLDGPGVGA